MGMTREAIEYFKFHRKIFCEDHLKICPKDSIAYQATLKEKEFYDMAIKALEQESRKGHWIKHNTPNNNTYYDCSLCGCVAPCTETADSYLWKLSNFCPDCGAKMEND